MINIAIITARGGSKRIPRKNIRDFCGKPIISYSIKIALDSNLFDEVMVSTEDPEIAVVAERYGAHVPFMRSAQNARDDASTEDAVLEVVSEYAKRDVDVGVICCIYPTAPLISKEILIKAHNQFVTHHAEALLPVVQFSYPPQRALLNKEGILSFQWKQYAESRSQDLEPLYHDAGAFYFIKTEVLKREHTLIPATAEAFVLDELYVQDIDNVSDWKLAEIKYQWLMSHNE